MRVLVLGASGMAGHKLLQVLGARHDVVGSVRGAAADSPLAQIGRWDLVGDVDAMRPETVTEAIRRVAPEAVVNAIGLIKQDPAAADPHVALAVNALLPRRLARWCRAAGARLIHLGTDHVFSGTRGRYTEDDVADAGDLYGRTKELGDVEQDGCLTLRTSFIGRELRGHRGLLAWFLRRQGGRVPGYARVVFSGITTNVLAAIVSQVLYEHPGLSGLYHVAAEPISKLALLRLLQSAYGLDVEIAPVAAPVSDHSLLGERFRRATGIAVPGWEAMVDELARDATPYPAAVAA